MVAWNYLYCQTLPSCFWKIDYKLIEIMILLFQERYVVESKLSWMSEEGHRVILYENKVRIVIASVF